MTNARLGFFGKLPSHGDFIDRDLPRSFIAPWDRWLQGVIANSRQLLGPAWLDCYLVAPIWRFVLPPGVCGPEGWVGLTMPSVDRVGRHFPFTVAFPRGLGGCALADLLSAEPWLIRCEDVALNALGGDMDAEALVERLGEIEPTIAGPAETTCTSSSASGEIAWQLALPPAPAPGAIALAVAESLLRGTGTPYSLWWSEGSETVERSLLIHRGLPTARDFAAMLDGRWGEWGWGRCRVPTPPVTQPDPPAAIPPAGTPSDAIPSDAIQSDAIPSDATPSDAAPSDATPSDATPSDATPSDAEPAHAQEAQP